MKLLFYRVTITYVTKEGERITVNGKEGDSLLDVANDNHLEFPGFGNHSLQASLNCQ